MKRLLPCSIALLIFLLPASARASDAGAPTGRSTSVGLDSDRDAITRTGDSIRAAFAQGNVAEIMKYHHPDVNKALAFQNVLIGREAVAENLRNTLRQFHLDFVENHVESLLTQNDTAVEQTLFTIRGTPLASGDSRFSSTAAPWWSTSATRTAPQAGHPFAKSSNLLPIDSCRGAGFA